MSSMGTFWAMVASQAICFGLFFWVLHIYVWGPIFRFLDHRREDIAGRIDKADQAGIDVERERQELRRRLDNIEEEARHVKKEAAGEGRVLAEQLVVEAQKNALEIRNHARQMARLEYEKAMIEVQESMVDITMKATEELLHESLNEDRQRRLVGDFIRDLDRR